MVPLFLILIDWSSILDILTSSFWGYSNVSFLYYLSLSNSFFFSSGFSSDFSFSIYFSITSSFLAIFNSGGALTFTL